MAENLFTAHLTMEDHLAPIRETHLGQAHFAGTGPEGKTCRQCFYWQPQRRGTTILYEGDGSVMHLCSGKCCYPILNKADRLIPHEARSCRLFEERIQEIPATREYLRKPKKETADA